VSNSSLKAIIAWLGPWSVIAYEVCIMQ
jgi:hypothetical protein